MRFCVLQARKVEVRQVNFNRTFIARMIAKLDWSALRMAADAVSKAVQCVCVKTPYILLCLSHYIYSVDIT